MDRYALIIGIDQYPLLRRVLPSGQTLSKDLKGCVNDARLMAQMLRDRYYFPEKNISLLINEQATRAGILGGLEALSSGVAPGDMVVLFYAGHGSQMVDREKTKLSGWDETLVPYDSGRNAQPNRDITDDELRGWLLRLAGKTPYITLIFDCCYSATLHRDAFTTDGRGIGRDERAADELPPSPLSAEQIQQLESTIGSLPGQPESGEWLPSSDRYVVLAGCRSDETAKEHSVSDGKQLVSHGSLTYFLVDRINKSTPGATYRDVFEQAALEVSKRYDQHPIPEGALDRVLFDVADRPPPPYFLVTKVRQGVVTIAAGQSQGVLRGSEWALFPPSASELQVTNQPRAKITKVGALSAEGSLLSSDFIVAEYSRAVLARQPIECQWRIELIGTPSPATAAPEEINNPGVPQLYVGKLINDSPWLRLASDSGTAQARVYLLKPRTEVQTGDPLPQLGPLRNETWAVVDSAGELCMKPLHFMQIQRLAANLEKLVRKDFVKELENPASKLTGLVDMQLLSQQADGLWAPLPQPLTGAPTVLPGTGLAIELANRHYAPLYVAVLQLDADGAMSQIYPPVGSSEPLRAHGTSRIGDGEGNRISARFPADLPPRADGQPPLEVMCGFKLLVTTQPVDLRPLLQEAVRLSQVEFRGSESALGQLFSTAFLGSGLRATLGPKAATDDWASSSRWLRVSRRKS